VNGIIVAHTTHLVAEMVVDGALSEADGESIFQSVYGQRAADYQAMLNDYR
jgi:hypothetical protein